MSPFLPSTFYYTAAALNALTIPKHILVGIKNVGPAVDTIPPKPELARTKSILVPTWESCNMFLVGSGESQNTSPIPKAIPRVNQRAEF